MFKRYDIRPSKAGFEVFHVQSGAVMGEFAEMAKADAFVWELIDEHAESDRNKFNRGR